MIINYCRSRQAEPGQLQPFMCTARRTLKRRLHPGKPPFVRPEGTIGPTTDFSQRIRSSGIAIQLRPEVIAGPRHCIIAGVFAHMRMWPIHALGASSRLGRFFLDALPNKQRVRSAD